MERHERRVLLGSVTGAVCALGFLALLGFHAAHSPPTSPSPSSTLPPIPLRPLAGVTVVLDPGHGGQDPGALGGPFSEAALTYRTAVEVSASLRAQGAEVRYTVRSRQLDPMLAVTEPLLTRPTDAVLASTGMPLQLRHSPRPLWQRAATARWVWAHRAKWDRDARWNVFFLSLHYDHYRTSGVSGSLVCVDRRVRRLPALGAALAAQMALGNFRRGDDYRGVAGIAGRDLGVLNPDHNPIPEKALLEVATLSNPQDAMQADDPAWRTEMARRITQSIILVHQESRERR